MNRRKKLTNTGKYAIIITGIVINITNERRSYASIYRNQNTNRI